MIVIQESLILCANTSLARIVARVVEHPSSPSSSVKSRNDKSRNRRIQTPWSEKDKVMSVCISANLIACAHNLTYPRRLAIYTINAAYTYFLRAAQMVDGDMEG